MIARARPKALGSDEARAVAWSSALFFCVLASWYTLRPLRDALGIVGATRDLPRLFLVTLGVSLAVAPALSALVSRYPRRRFLPMAYRFMGTTLLLFFALLHAAPGVWTARAFFVWSSVFNLLGVTITWGFMADLFSRAEGVRVFALVGAGGTVGSIVGSAATTFLVTRVGAPAMLLVAIALLEGAARCVRRLATSPLAARAPAHDAPCAGGGTIAWLWRAAREPFFAGVCAYIVIFTVTSSVLYLEQAHIVKASVVGTEARTALFARMDLLVNALALLLQLFVVGRVVRAVGVGFALAVLPVFTLFAFVGVRAFPFLGVLVTVQVLRRALDFALSKPTREVLFTATLREDRYKTKSFIDTFVYRGGDALGAWGVEGLPGSFLIASMIALCGIWMVTALALGTRMERTSSA